MAASREPAPPPTSTTVFTPVQSYVSAICWCSSRRRSASARLNISCSSGSRRMRSQGDSPKTCAKLDSPVMTLWPSAAADCRTCSAPQKRAAFRRPPGRSRKKSETGVLANTPGETSRNAPNAASARSARVRESASIPARVARSNAGRGPSSRWSGTPHRMSAPSTGVRYRCDNRLKAALPSSGEGDSDTYGPPFQAGKYMWRRPVRPVLPHGRSPRRSAYSSTFRRRSRPSSPAATRRAARSRGTA